MKRSVRMGIDVGGTHTKAVAIDNDTHKMIGEPSVVKTTHDDPRGVAAGVVQSFETCLNQNGISPDEVVFVAHSTTQATNALIEGDVAPVGVIGMAKGGLEGFLAKRQTRLADIELDEKKKIKIYNEYLPLKQCDDAHVKVAIEKLQHDGAKVLVASMAFGVDEGGPESTVAEVAKAEHIPTTMASDITKLYGLTRRTRTAAINASILPKMLDTALSTESSVRSAGVKVPLMIMRGDGGVMEINEMKKRPVLTMLSGPAASVMGSLIYLKASNGIYFEVGGTTTNIGVIKNGRPAIDYSVVGGHPTYISSLDVRVLGDAGGSMIRANKNGVVDVGPRSAHIAGLDYAAFTDPAKIVDPHVEFFSPKEGDPDDYVKLVNADGSAFTITNTCAANALGLVTPEYFSYGNQESCRKAIQVLADYAGTTVDDIATQIMEKAFAKIEPVFNELVEKYKLEKDQISLVGVGGGAAALVTYFSKKTGVKYSIPRDAEVISSIGVALSMVRDVVERIVPNPTKEDIRGIKNEALNKAVESGATPDSVDVHVEIDPQTSKITAIATGSTEVKTSDLTASVDDDEARDIAAADMRIEPAQAELVSKTDYFYIYGAPHTGDDPAQPVRIVDKKGFIKVQRGRAMCEKTTAANYLDTLARLWDEMAVYQAENIAHPDFYLCLGARVMDFSATDFEQLQLLTDLEVASLEPTDEVIVVAANIDQT
ncbi:MAG: hydantoinase/oxoprolinase family protein [Schleiferilactobacillus perolens]|nr:hydantoinase/oxoprolinase family protein [Schleiferilactobacillus perolens]MCI1890560.1 hydantoinase/oxoprolinase family protein [Schleiferilactobacillus harbinensis]MCI1912225.1 hydantoinase/oxoprolinase family protein [Schleiferilactobacillus harbinensis]